MASVNYYQLEGWIGGGLIWNYSVAPIDSTYWDVMVSPIYLTDPLESPGNLEIASKGVSTIAHAPPPVDEPEGKTTYTLQLWFEVRNNVENDSYFNIDIINVQP
jgi:hypothetical protein